MIIFSMRNQSAPPPPFFAGFKSTVSSHPSNLQYLRVYTRWFPVNLTKSRLKGTPH